MLRQFTVVVIAGLTLSACSVFSGHDLDYRQAEVLEPMTVPGNMIFLGNQQRYTVPDQHARLTGPRDGEKGFSAPEPPRLVGAATRPQGDRADSSADRPVVTTTDTAPVLGKDGSGYPLLMMPVDYNWAWEQVGSALTETDLQVTDRDRDLGLYYLTVPERYRLSSAKAKLKLNHTPNGIQVQVLKGQGAELAPKDSGLAILEQVQAKLLVRARVSSLQGQGHP